MQTSRPARHLLFRADLQDISKSDATQDADMHQCLLPQWQACATCKTVAILFDHVLTEPWKIKSGYMHMVIFLHSEVATLLNDMQMVTW